MKNKNEEPRVDPVVWEKDKQTWKTFFSVLGMIYGIPFVFGMIAGGDAGRVIINVLAVTGLWLPWVVAWKYASEREK